MLTLSLFLCILAPNDVGIPPLHENTQIRLETAVDGLDSRGESFAALVEETALWAPPFDTEGIAFEYESLLERPETFRGSPMRIEGVLVQQQSLGGDWQGVQEWFIRDMQARLYCVYVVGLEEFQDGTSVSIVARFYKTMEMVARDGRNRMYPTFVTSHLAIAVVGTVAQPQQLFILIPFILVAALFVLILSRLVKRKRIKRPRIQIQTDDVVEAVGQCASSLSDNPSQALAEMYEQSEGDT
jgi:hypothetical protein